VKVFTQSASHLSSIEFGLNHNATSNDVQPAGKAKQRGNLCLATTGFVDVKTAQLVFDR
jgi:hypothetical protein